MTTEVAVETLYPDPLFSEQNPEEIDAKARKAVRNILQNPEVVDLGVEKNLIGIGISSAMHSLILTDKNYSLLSNMLIWSDKRSRKQADSLLEEGTGFEIYRRTGTPIHPMTPLCKLLWMKETGYEAFRKAAYVMTGKDYLAAKWSGRAVIDYGMASSTGLFDLQSLDWDDEALRLCSVDKEQLAEVVPPTFILPGLKPEVQRDFGLTRDVPIAIGSSDGLLANLGSGAILPGEVNISVGTSGAIRQFAAGFPVNDKMETFTYAFDREMSVIGGATNNGGIVLDFLMELAGFTGTTGEFLEGAENVSPGADGLLFHPYINGERTPIWNAEARGNLFGMRLGHTRAHLARAGLEGITFNIYRIGKALEKMIGKPKQITVNGGLTRSKLWVQILANVFGEEVHVSNTPHNAAWGAAFTVLVATGEVKDFAEIKKSLPESFKVTPNEKDTQIYRELYSKYLELGALLEAQF